MSKVKKIIAIIVCVVCIFSMFCISTSAASLYHLPVNQPRADNYSGYIEYLVRDSNGVITPFVTFWQVNNGSHRLNDIETFPLIYITVEYNRILLTCQYNNFDSTDGYSFTFSGGSVNGVGGTNYWSYDIRNGAYFSVNAYTGSSDVVGWKIYGNGTLKASSPPNSLTWNMSYSETSVLYEAIMTMAQSSANSSNSITQNATDNANKIQQNQNENTDKIIENQQQIQENEKNEAESSGQGSVDYVSGAIEDKSAGFISSIGSLVSSMSYEGTACAWTFPALKLPAIEGVMPEYQLTEEKPIDFEFWVNKIPANILLLVRSLLTIALIGYCFKELYSTISYVLTLKGGGNNE